MPIKPSRAPRGGRSWRRPAQSLDGGRASHDCAPAVQQASPTDSPSPGPAGLTPPTRAARLREVAGVFTRLGFTAFGGPAVHVSLMEDEFVARRKWLDRRHFMDLVAAISFIPGPNSTELAIHLGLLRAGWPGLVLAGVCFIVPAVLVILPIAWAYVTWGTLPRVGATMALIHCAVVSVIAIAAARFVRSSVTDRFTLAVAVASAAIATALVRSPQYQPEVTAIALSAVAGVVWAARRRRQALRDDTPPRPPEPPSSGGTAGVLFDPTPLAVGSAVATTSVAVATTPLGAGLLQLALVFLKIGATLFGSGYVLVSYLRSGVVAEHRWLTEQQLLDAIAVGQFTPGPLLTTATFVGYVAGHGPFGGGHLGGLAGAVVATVAIFLPSFLLVAACAPVLQRLRQHPLARGALDAMNAAVAALLVVVCVQIGTAALNGTGWLGAAVMLASAGALWRGLNATWVIVAAGALGAAQGALL